MTSALLIIDVQNDYFKDGKLPLYHADKALEHTIKLEKYFKLNNQPIIYVQHIKYIKDADFFEANTNGVALHPKLSVNQESIIIEKQFPNSFYQTNLLNKLNEMNVNELVICGMMTHMCVDSTTRAAKELGFNPTLIHDATATRDLIFKDRQVSADAVQNAFIASLANFSNVLSTEEFISTRG